MKRTLIILSFITLLCLIPNAFADNKSLSDRLNYAVNLFHDNNYIRATEELKAVYNEGGDDSSYSFEASYLLGMTYREMKEWKEATDWLQKASRYQPLADYALYHAGEAYLNSKEYESALASYRELTSRFPDSKWKVDAHFQTAIVLLQLGKKIEALSALNTFVRENPASPMAPAALINIAKALEEDARFDEAYHSYKKTWLNYPSSPESRKAWSRMAELSLMPSFNPTLSPSLDERYKRVGLMFSEGSFDDVINDLSSLLKDVEKEKSGIPNWFLTARYNLAESYYNRKGLANAESILIKLIEDSGSEKSLFLYGKVLQRLGKKTEAASIYERIDKDYHNGDASARASYRLADMAEGDGEVLKAKELYHKVYINFPKSDIADDALWKEGWINYLERNYDNAAIIFQKFLNEYPLSEFADTVYYWSGRLAEKAGEKDEAIAKYLDIINKFPLSFYSVASRERLYFLSKEVSLLSWTKSVNSLPSKKIRTADKSLSFHLNKGKILLLLGFKKHASEELALAESRCSDNAILLEIAALQTKAGDYFRPQRIILNNFQMYLKDNKGSFNTDLWAFAFPLGYSDYIRENADKNDLNRYLIHAIIREESTYRPEIVSKAGAIGLMQLMPTTGDEISKKNGFKNFIYQDLYSPEVNITMGSIYIRKLLEEHKGNLPLAVASYNAGPNAVAKWISRYGTVEMDEFIEKIPYSETRNYVKKVLRSYDIYERLYDERASNFEIVGYLR